MKWLFPNQWFGLHLRWFFSSYISRLCWGQHEHRIIGAMMSISSVHVPYSGPSQTFVTKTGGYRYVTDQEWTKIVLNQSNIFCFSMQLYYPQSGDSGRRLKARRRFWGEMMILIWTEMIGWWPQSQDTQWIESDITDLFDIEDKEDLFQDIINEDRDIPSLHCFSRLSVDTVQGKEKHQRPCLLPPSHTSLLPRS